MNRKKTITAISAAVMTGLRERGADAILRSPPGQRHGECPGHRRGPPSPPYARFGPGAPVGVRSGHGEGGGDAGEYRAGSAPVSGEKMAGESLRHLSRYHYGKRSPVCEVLLRAGVDSGPVPDPGGERAVRSGSFRGSSWYQSAPWMGAV